MDEGSRFYQIPEVNLAAGYGAGKIIQKIGKASLGEKLLLRNDSYLREETYEKILVNHLEFFSPEEEVAEIVEILESLFTLETEEKEEIFSGLEEVVSESKDFFEETPEESEEAPEELEETTKESEEASEELEETTEESEEALEELEETAEELKETSGESKDITTEEKNIAESEETISEEDSLETDQQQELRVVLCRKQEKPWEEGEKNPRIHLKITKRPFQIPFEVEIIPYKGEAGQVQEKIFQGTLPEGEGVAYYMFDLEEYISRSFYKIMDELERINNMSWYQEIYDILLQETVKGRKVSQGFEQLLLDDTIPALKDRLEIIRDYEDYKYMEKRWINQNRRERTDYPQWNQVIQLLVKFFTPVVEMASRNEIFIGDWIPQFGRYLD